MFLLQFSKAKFKCGKKDFGLCKRNKEVSDNCFLLLFDIEIICFVMLSIILIEHSQMFKYFYTQKSISRLFSVSPVRR